MDDSKKLQTFIQDVRDDLNNLDDLLDYYDFLGHHNIRTIVFNPEDESSFFEGSVTVSYTHLTLPTMRIV